jgi:signal transduction histidine kinase
MRPLQLPQQRRPLIAAATAAVIVFAFAAALSIITWRGEYERQSAYISTLATMGERSLDTYFAQLESALAFLGEELVEHEETIHPKGATKRLQEFRNRFPTLAVVALVHPDGRIMSSTAYPVGPLPSIAGTADFDESMADFRRGRNFTITRPLIGRVTGQWQISLRSALRGSRGELRGFVATALPLSSAQGFWAGSPLPRDVILGIVRDDGYLLVRHPTPAGVALDKIYQERRSGALYDHLRRFGFPQSGVIEGHSASTGEANLIAFSRFKSFPLTFRVSVPMARVRAAWFSAILPLYAISAALLAALVAINLWQVRLQRRWSVERERQITALEAANQDLTRANNELDSFSYTVAHDLRAPVRALDGFAGLLRAEHGAALGDDGRDLLARIRGATARMEALIEGMLTFARLSREPLKVQLLDTRALVASVAAEFVPADAQCELVVGDLPPSVADPVMLRAVWSNLLSNAVKYSRHSAAPKIEIGYERDAFFVRDNGAGFDMAHSHNLFGVFSRLHTPAQFEGTGIGLAIVKRIVERHGGRVEAQAEVGRGAEFRFSLGPPVGA